MRHEYDLCLRVPVQVFIDSQSLFFVEAESIHAAIELHPNSANPRGNFGLQIFIDFLNLIHRMNYRLNLVIETEIHFHFVTKPRKEKDWSTKPESAQLNGFFHRSHSKGCTSSVHCIQRQCHFFDAMAIGIRLYHRNDL